jgi:hypothetical protein
MLKIFCKIVGADYQILRTCGPESKKKIIIVANALFIPVLLWLITGFLISYEILCKNLGLSILTSLICGTIIFLIERLIIMSQGSSFQTAIRLVMGLCVATLGSIALDEIIFKNDIDIQVQSNKAKYIKEETGKYCLDIENSIQKQSIAVENSKNKWKTALIDANKEADGTGGSGRKGVSSITKLKLETASYLFTDYNKALTKLTLMESEKSKNTYSKQLELSKHFNSNSILVRVKAMFELILNDSAMLVVYVVFSILMFVLEFIVIITKYTVGTTSYDRRVLLIEEIGKRKMEKLLETSTKAFEPSENLPSLRRGLNIIKLPAPRIFN